MGDVPKMLGELWHAHSGSMLSRRLGDLDLAEDALQEAVGEALRRWPHDGVTDSATGWLVTTAWRKAIDRLRRERAGREKLALVAGEPPVEPTGDDRLTLILASPASWPR